MQRPPIIDPRLVPVIGHDTVQPAVALARLGADALRARFAAPPPWTPEILGDGRLLDREPAAASVLVPLVLREGGVSVLLTLRSDHLKDHAGQISFPGGRAEPEDIDAVATALREFEEEVGVDRRYIEVIGTLPIYSTVTNFMVTPVVALVEPDFDPRPDPSEVAEVFEVPLSFLMTPAHHQRHAFDWQGGRREFWSIPWPAEGRDEPYFIWGATAAMLRNFYRLLAA